MKDFRGFFLNEMSISYLLSILRDDSTILSSLAFVIRFGFQRPKPKVNKTAHKNSETFMIKKRNMRKNSFQEKCEAIVLSILDYIALM